MSLAIALLVCIMHATRLQIIHVHRIVAFCRERYHSDGQNAIWDFAHCFARGISSLARCARGALRTCEVQGLTMISFEKKRQKLNGKCSSKVGAHEPVFASINFHPFRDITTAIDTYRVEFATAYYNAAAIGFFILVGLTVYHNLVSNYERICSAMS